MLGAIVGYDFKLGEARDLAMEFLGRQDVANGNGFLGTLQATYGCRWARAGAVSMGVETTWASSDYMKAPISPSTAPTPAAAGSTSTTPTTASRTSAPTPRSAT